MSEWIDRIFVEFNTVSVVIRLVICLLVGALIGRERAKHGRAAGMRTHILVCLGSALTALCGIYGMEVLGNTGDMMRISAQVISGVGFLGAGMILIKNNSVIIGLTTAAGMWATAAIGIAIGLGFYVGGITVAVLCYVTTVLLARLENNKKNVESVYAELDDMHLLNDVLSEISKMTDGEFSKQITAPKSGTAGHIGLELVFEDSVNFEISNLNGIEHIAFAVENKSLS